MIELQIIKKFCLDKDCYLRYNKYINYTYIKENYNNIYKIYNIIKLYYEEYNKTNITKEELEAFYLSNYPVLKEIERKDLTELLNRIFNSDVNEELLLSLLDTHKERGLATQIALKALKIADGFGSLNEVVSLISEYETRSEDAHEDEFVTDDLERLYNEQVTTIGLRWRLDCLNHSLGSLRKGDFGFVFARPETGKTTFLASEITEMARQTDRPIIWFNNEEQGRKVMLRCYQAALGMTIEELSADFAGNQRKFMELTKGNIKIYGQENIIGKHSIEEVCRRFNPSLIIMDQIDKVKGFKADRHDLELKETYQWARELAKLYGPVIGVCQAGGSGEGKAHLTMNDVDSSKTGKQGEADWILGIGKIEDAGYEYVRYFNISKNKLIGDPDTRPEMRHGKPTVNIKPSIARYI